MVQRSVTIVASCPVVRYLGGPVPAIIIVMIYFVTIVDYNCIPTPVMTTIITTMIVIVPTRIHTKRHNCRKRKPTWVITVIIRWIIRNIGG